MLFRTPYGIFGNSKHFLLYCSVVVLFWICNTRFIISGSIWTIRSYLSGCLMSITRLESSLEFGCLLLLAHCRPTVVSVECSVVSVWIDQSHLWVLVFVFIMEPSEIIF